MGYILGQVRLFTETCSLRLARIGRAFPYMGSLI